MNHRQGFEPQKIEFYQSDFFQIGHRELGHDFVVTGFVEGDMIHEGFLRNDHARRMSRGMSRQAFQGHGRVHEFLHFGILIDQFLQAWFLFQGILEGDVELGGNQLCHPVNFGVGEVHHSPHIPDGCFGT